MALCARTIADAKEEDPTPPYCVRTIAVEEDPTPPYCVRTIAMEEDPTLSYCVSTIVRANEEALHIRRALTHNAKHDGALSHGTTAAAEADEEDERADADHEAGACVDELEWDVHVNQRRQGRLHLV